MRWIRELGCLDDWLSSFCSLFPLGSLPSQCRLCFSTNFKTTHNSISKTHKERERGFKKNNHDTQKKHNNLAHNIGLMPWSHQNIWLDITTTGHDQVEAISDIEFRYIHSAPCWEDKRVYDRWTDAYLLKEQSSVSFQKDLNCQEAGHLHPLIPLHSVVPHECYHHSDSDSHLVASAGWWWSRW